VIIPPLLGIALMLGIWALVAIKSGNIPGPGQDLGRAQGAVRRPLLPATARTTRASAGTCSRRCKRVGIGFGFAALVGIPMGFCSAASPS
jgi:nitrate/nitrite transport system permease protein